MIQIHIWDSKQELHQQQQLYNKQSDYKLSTYIQAKVSKIYIKKH